MEPRRQASSRLTHLPLLFALSLLFHAILKHLLLFSAVEKQDASVTACARVCACGHPNSREADLQKPTWRQNVTLTPSCTSSTRSFLEEAFVWNNIFPIKVA